ncbi:von Willebrand factor type A domain-containing protein [Devosia albogilva]|uniref:von Willebrand factor type A domain-containing protein n=1 Tax=Devosia albogilva TaxID=429726 RepID=A0ABW5QIN5_9HYPH
MSTEHPDDPLRRLSGVEPPPPRPDARAAAVAAARAAFEAEQTKKSAPATKGAGWRRRLTSIVSSFRGISIMDMRIPVGTAAIALLILPLGWQLYSTTALSPADTVVAPQPVREELAQAPAPQSPAKVQPRAPEPVADAATSTAEIADTAPPPPAVLMESEVAPQGIVMPAPSSPPVGGLTRSADFMAPAEPKGDSFTSFDEQRLKVVAEEPVSTFSVDVDTASYSYVRRMLEDGMVPEPDAVRVEELINYFPYDYPAPGSAEVPFRPSVAVYPTPWNPATQLIHIGIKGYEPPVTEDRPSNLVFLIDTSGSMDEADKLPLLKRAFSLLVEQLSGNDTISIVAYAGSAGVVLEPTRATEKATIIAALDGLWAGGSTAGAEGIELAYRLAEDNLVQGGVNRVILATDGDFNVGIEDPEELERFIAARRDRVSLSVLGFGQGNLGDDTMQALAQNGNGNASYISSFSEARKVLVEEIGGTLQTIAQDVKIQVEFNPAVVSEYRLIGYETRALNREDFNNDKVDAGDIGAGHTVTALYEITPVGSDAALVDPLRYGTEAETAAASDEIAFLRIRYKQPGETISRLIEQPITPDLVAADVDEVGEDFRFAAAVAAFGQKLKGSIHAGMSWDGIVELAQGARGKDEGGYRSEFVSLAETAALLKPDTHTDPCQSSSEGCE